MGGYGSGNTKTRPPQRPTVGEVPRLNVEQVLMWARADGRGDDLDAAAIDEPVELKVEFFEDCFLVTATVTMVATSQHWGRRWWFWCFCGRRCAHLYHRHRLLACRLCHGLQYRVHQDRRRFDRLHRYMANRYGCTVREAATAGRAIHAEDLALYRDLIWAMEKWGGAW